MDDLDIINSVEQVEVMVNSIQKGAENQKTSALVMLENLLGVFLICSTLFRSKSNLHEYAARLRGASTRGQKFHRLKSESSPIHLDKLSHIRVI